MFKFSLSPNLSANFFALICYKSHMRIVCFVNKRMNLLICFVLYDELTSHAFLQLQRYNLLFTRIDWKLGYIWNLQSNKNPRVVNTQVFKARNN